MASSVKNPANITISRKEILQWVNGLLKTDYNKVEELHTGVAYCQLMHMIDPNATKLNKIKFEAKTEIDYIANFKLVQNVFNKNHVNKEIPINKLIKGHFLDNFEFLKWFKQYFEENYDGNQQEYNALEIRNNMKNKEKSALYKKISSGSDRRLGGSTQSINNNNNHNNNSKNLKPKLLSVSHQSPSSTVNS